MLKLPPVLSEEQVADYFNDKFLVMSEYAFVSRLSPKFAALSKYQYDDKLNAIENLIVHSFQPVNEFYYQVGNKRVQTIQAKRRGLQYLLVALDDNYCNNYNGIEDDETVSVGNKTRLMSYYNINQEPFVTNGNMNLDVIGKLYYYVMQKIDSMEVGNKHGVERQQVIARLIEIFIHTPSMYKMPSLAEVRAKRKAEKQQAEEAAEAKEEKDRLEKERLQKERIAARALVIRKQREAAAAAIQAKEKEKKKKIKKKKKKLKRLEKNRSKTEEEKKVDTHGQHTMNQFCIQFSSMFQYNV